MGRALGRRLEEFLLLLLLRRLKDTACRWGMRAEGLSLPGCDWEGGRRADKGGLGCGPTITLKGKMLARFVLKEGALIQLCSRLTIPARCIWFIQSYVGPQQHMPDCVTP